MNQYYHSEEPSCCIRQESDALAGLAVAMGYVPWQFLHTLYEPDKALQVGTIFP